MQAIRKRIMIDSDTIRIPELQKFIGKTMEIILLEDSEEKNKAFLDLAGKISLDDEAVNDLRENSKI
ncbi:MAG: hypothetical protein U9N62_09580 [Thermotogota bacterium]|nr:hypothetical protein [Thermotogota bacterium]